MIVTQFCDYSKHNWIVQFKLVNCVVYVYLSGVSFKEAEEEGKKRKI